MTETYSIANPSHFNTVEPDIDQLQQEITDSSIASATIQYITRTGDVVDIVFDATINGGDQTTLDGLVSSHVPIAIVNYDNTITINPRNDTFSSTSYTRVGTITYEGTDSTNSIKKITSLSYKDSGVTNYALRLYDVTNTSVIASATFTNESEAICDLGTISNLPTSAAILEIQGKKTGGTGNQKFLIDSVTLYS